MNDATVRDYRDSHQGKGRDYDEDLGTRPWDLYMADAEKVLLKKVIRQLFPLRIGRSLDFACGTGRILTLLEQWSIESVGVDVSPSMVGCAREKCTKSRIILHDLTTNSGVVGQVDLVTAFRFFGNAQQPLREAAMAAISDVLPNGAYLVINNHRNHGSIRNRISRLRRHADDGADLTFLGLSKLLQSHGFVTLAKYGIGFWVIRDQLRCARYLQSRLARIMDPLFQWGPLARYCPDYVIVAQKRNRTP